MALRNVGMTSFLAASLTFYGCSDPKKPLAVTPGAVRVEGAKTGYWQICTIDQRARVHCTVWNDAGTVLKDETYLPLDEGPAPREAELGIRAGQICSGPYQVCLASGRILLPESQFEQLKVLMKR
jgi:hypothetical protein